MLRICGGERRSCLGLAMSEAVARNLHGYPYSPTSPAQEACECDESSGDELFGSDCNSLVTVVW